MNLSRLVLAIAVLVASHAGASGGDEVGGAAPHRIVEPESRDCGAYCVAYVRRKVLDEQSDFESLRRMLAADEHGFCSMADIRRVLDGLGIQSTGTRVEGDFPRRLFVARLNQALSGKPMQHFIVVDARSEVPIYYSPPDWVETADLAASAKSIDPVILVVADSRLWPDYLPLAAVLAGAAAYCVHVFRTRRSVRHGPAG